MMATTASAQRMPRGFEHEGTQLPFFSKDETEGSAGVDVFSQDVTIVPNSNRESFGFGFPPPELVGVCTAIPRREESSCSSSGTRPEKVVISQVRRGDNTCTVDL